MSSKVPEILDALQARLQTVAPVYRALEGRSLPLDPKTDMPVIALRLSSDLPSTKIITDTVTKISLTIEIVVSEAEGVSIDASLADLLFSVRAALIRIEKIPPFSDLLLHPESVQFSEAIYGYPESGSAYALVRQPITIQFTENYR